MEYGLGIIFLILTPLILNPDMPHDGLLKGNPTPFLMAYPGSRRSPISLANYLGFGAWNLGFFSQHPASCLFFSMGYEL
jgi:hypothetical protein